MTDAQTTATNPAQPAGTLAALRARSTAVIDEIEAIPGEISDDLTNAKEKAHEIIGFVESHFAQAAAEVAPAASASSAS
jgi:hypothetical protein